ncbi:hypothetical protein MAR_033941 [Mya arenaria]|uniref:PIN domain-containing protein n=1 Tax=Mya arenaria TaxID=6604 RepID=A0ABY7GD06_MYAAR|nr:hypothetical protein MAR_033941 [Mya arenaria]
MRTNQEKSLSGLPVLSATSLQSPDPDCDPPCLGFPDKPENQSGNVENQSERIGESPKLSQGKGPKERILNVSKENIVEAIKELQQVSDILRADLSKTKDFVGLSTPIGRRVPASSTGKDVASVTSKKENEKAKPRVDETCERQYKSKCKISPVKAPKQSVNLDKKLGQSVSKVASTSHIEKNEAPGMKRKIVIQNEDVDKKSNCEVVLPLSKRFKSCTDKSVMKVTANDKAKDKCVKNTDLEKRQIKGSDDGSDKRKVRKLKGGFRFDGETNDDDDDDVGDSNNNTELRLFIGEKEKLLTTGLFNQSQDSGFHSTLVSPQQKERGVEEDMEIDNVLTEVRSQLKCEPGTGVGCIDIPVESCTTRGDKSSLTELELLVVLDTNVLISNLDMVDDLKDWSIQGLGWVCLYVPWIVLMELDRLKSTVSHGKPCLMETAREEFEAEYGNAILFSNDHNLCIKSLVTDIPAFNSKDILSGIENVAAEMKQSKTTVDQISVQLQSPFQQQQKKLQPQQQQQQQQQRTISPVNTVAMETGKFPPEVQNREVQFNTKVVKSGDNSMANGQCMKNLAFHSTQKAPMVAERYTGVLEKTLDGGVWNGVTTTTHPQCSDTH